MRSVLLLLIIGLVAATGCAGRKGGSPAAGPKPQGEYSPLGQKLVLTPETGLVGKVVRLNVAARFVVMSFPIGHLPALDQRLSAYRLGLKTGEIRVTGPQLDDKIVGDVVVGDVQPGDEVRDR